MVDFHELRQPEADDLEDIAFNVHQRFRRWLRRHGLFKDEADEGFSNESSELSALEACAQGSLGLGNLVKKRGKPRSGNQDADEGGLEQQTINGRVGVSHGYSLYAGNAIDADDKDSRERLLRYCLRAPLSLERLSIGPDGNVIYQVKATRHGIETQRVMTPVQFMARLVALIPPPRHPLLRYFGAFGSHSAWRNAVVPKVCQNPDQNAVHSRGAPKKASNPLSDPRDDSAPNCTPTSMASTASLVESAQTRKPTVEKIDVMAKPRWRIDWATLLKRVHDVDALQCVCGGRLKFVELVTEAATAEEILQSMALPTGIPPIARARSPDLIDGMPADDRV